MRCTPEFNQTITNRKVLLIIAQRPKGPTDVLMHRELITTGKKHIAKTAMPVPTKKKADLNIS